MMMTKTEVAEFLRVSTKTVERGVKAGSNASFFGSLVLLPGNETVLYVPLVCTL